MNMNFTLKENRQTIIRQDFESKDIEGSLVDFIDRMVEKGLIDRRQFDKRYNKVSITGIINFLKDKNNRNTLKYVMKTDIKEFIDSL